MSQAFLLDANVFVQAKRRFYPFDICPGYWKALAWHQGQGQISSVDRVRDEIERGGDDLWDWVRETFGEGSFVRTDTAEVLGWYGEMVSWVQAQPQFQPQAKEEFAREEVADGWLASYAKTQPGGIIVTLEEFDPNVKRRVPLPNVCSAFGVKCVTPFEMLRRLGVRLDWQEPR